MPWPMFERIWQQEFALHDMIKIFGLDPGAVARRDGGQAYGQMKANCVACVAADQCRAWRYGTDTASKPMDFCSNYRALRSLSGFDRCDR